MKPVLTLSPKLDKDTHTQKNYRPISSMNIDAKLPNETMANQIQEYIKRIIHHNQVGFIPRMQGWFNACQTVNIIYHINKSKDQNHFISSIDAEKAFNNIQYLLMIKNSDETSNRRHLL
jgi:hypothetical protein